MYRFSRISPLFWYFLDLIHTFQCWNQMKKRKNNITTCYHHTRFVIPSRCNATLNCVNFSSAIPERYRDVSGEWHIFAALLQTIRSGIICHSTYVRKVEGRSTLPSPTVFPVTDIQWAIIKVVTSDCSSRVRQVSFSQIANGCRLADYLFAQEDKRKRCINFTTAITIA